ALESNGSPDVAVVMRGGSTSEMTSGLGADDVQVIAQAPGVAQGADGPVSSPELMVVVDVDKRSSGTPANVPFRGVTDNAFQIRDNLRIVEGRMFKRGLNEVIVGRMAAGQ